jgi:hypothetical protein
VPDLILLDIAMPQMDGWTVARAIRARAGALAHPAGLGQCLREPARAQRAAAGQRLPGQAGLVQRIARQDPAAPATGLGSPGDTGGAAVACAGECASDGATADAGAAHDKLATLLELGSIGYAKEILRQLDAMERQHPAYLPFTTELRQLVKQFRLNEYVTRIKELIRHDLNDVR